MHDIVDSFRCCSGNILDAYPKRDPFKSRQVYCVYDWGFFQCPQAKAGTGP
jgi:hypothetical protein